MYAAAEGKSTLGIPKSVGQDFTAADPGGSLPAHTGMPTGKKRRRGGRGKGGPGADHHANLNRAMASGDHTSAKKHALNLANSLHSHLNGGKVRDPSPTNTMMTSDTPMPVAGVESPSVPAQPKADSGFLARALMGRR